MLIAVCPPASVICSSVPDVEGWFLFINIFGILVIHLGVPRVPFGSRGLFIRTFEFGAPQVFFRPLGISITSIFDPRVPWEPLGPPGGSLGLFGAFPGVVLEWRASWLARGECGGETIRNNREKSDLIARVNF